MPGRADGVGVRDHASKVMPMRDAVARFVHDGDTVVIEGFTHLICFAAGHEIIRQRRRDLTLARLTPDLIYDQMIGAGCARKLVFSWAGNPGVGSLHAFRRAVEGVGTRDSGLEIEEDSHFGVVARLCPCSAGLPGMIVDAVVVEPWGAHPSYAQGYYDRDNDFYVAWEDVSRSPDRLARYLDEFVYGVPDRAAYLEKQPQVVKLKAKERMCAGVNYGY